jgi:hypothetical protein
LNLSYESKLKMRKQLFNSKLSKDSILEQESSMNKNHNKYTKHNVFYQMRDTLE